MAIINWDLVDGDTAELTRDGWSATRIATVSELTASYGYEKIGEAVDAISIPIGTIHPYYYNSALQSISATSVSSDVVTVALTYEPVLSVPYDIQISSSANSAQTNKDKNDTVIEVSYTYPSDYDGDPLKVSKTETVGKTVDTRIPTSTITISKREVITGGNLTDLSQQYVGTVNIAGWNIRPSDPARSWLCSSITGDYFGLYIQAGTEYTVYDTQYVFEYQYGGWDTEVVFLDPATGEPPDPATWSGDTHKTVELMQESNFTNLTIDIS